MLRAAAITTFCLAAFASGAFADPSEPPPVAVTSASQVIIVTPATAPIAAPVDPLPPTMPGAPQNESWSNVSHINGVPVPVGERNQYLYAIKHTNLALNPLGLVVGYYEAAVSHAIGNNIAISIEVAAQSHDGTSGEQVALTVPIYFKKVFTGPFIEPGFVVRNDNGGDCCDTCCDGCCASSSTTTTQFEMMIGWAWLFDNGLNMSFAAGIARNLNNNNNNNNGDSDVTDEISPAGYFRVGYAF